MVEIEKRNLNSDWVAGRIARLAGVRRRDVGLAGLKDRHAVTRQWFSVDLAGREPPQWEALSDGLQPQERIEVLSAARHNRKIRRGALRGNYFRLVLRQLTAPQQSLEQRLREIGC